MKSGCWVRKEGRTAVHCPEHVVFLAVAGGVHPFCAFRSEDPGTELGDVIVRKTTQSSKRIPTCRGK